MKHEQPAPTETYRGMPIFLYQDSGMAPGEYGAAFQWYGRLTTVGVEDWQQPTRANLLQAARDAIDLLKEVESQGLLEPDGAWKGVG